MKELDISKLPKRQTMAVIVEYPDEPGKEYAVYLFRSEIEGFMNMTDGKIVRIFNLQNGKELWNGKTAETVLSKGIHIPAEDD